jgi:AraC family transcriptional regulator
MNQATLPLDLTDRKEAARVLPHTPLIDSHHTGWKGLAFTHYRHPPHKTVAHCLLQHSLVITEPSSCIQIERHLDGKLQHYAHGSGRIDIIPAFLERWTNWKQDVEFSVIAICPTLLHQAAQDLMQSKIELIPHLSIDDPVIKQLALALKIEIQTGCLSGRLYGELLGSAIAARLIQNYTLGKPEFKSSGLSRSQLVRVIDYIKANLTQDISISDLAALTGMSKSHFSRSFKQSVGTAPYQYLIQQRVERAKQLLKQQTSSISNVALECGFANQTHLTKVFRQTTGMTPRTYQKQ